MLVRFHLPAQALGVHLRQFLAQGRIAPGDGVLVEATLDGLDRGLDDLGRRAEVGKALAEVDGIVLDGQSGHLADDRFSDVVKTMGGLHGRGEDENGV